MYAWFPAMNTRVDLMIYTDAQREGLVEIAEKIKDEICRIESFANRFDANSELSSINTNGYSKEIFVSKELFQLLSECQFYNHQTLGYFDITVNSFHSFRAGAASISLNKEMQAVKFLHPDVQLDLSGFIKGYSLRAVSEILKTENIDNALINAGNSSILAMGNHPFGKGWKIIPRQNNLASECILFNECLTTSGNKEDTKWPVMNPLSGKRVDKNKNVSVITADPALGEVLSTALYVADKDEKELILKQFSAQEVDW